MAAKVRWGVLSTAKIGMEKVIPAMQKSNLVEIVAIASRDALRAKKAAKQLGIPKSYGSYQELIYDRDIDAIYNPLPNHLHVAWTIKAAEAGKSVLCEKPLSMSVEDIKRLIRIRDKGKVKIGEAFMVDSHPQWQKARELARAASFGDLSLISCQFSYNNRDPKNIRNIKEVGGGGIYDIGTYAVHCSRYISGQEPKRLIALLDFDPAMKIDRLASVIMEFPFGHATFTCSTQIVPYQRMQIFGTKRRIEVEIPFNAPNNRKCRIFTDSGDLTGAGIQTTEFPVCDQYTLQGEQFSRAVLGKGDVPVDLENALGNMRVLEAIFTSARTGKWVTLA